MNRSAPVIPECLTDSYGHTMTPEQYTAWDAAGRPEWPATIRNEPDAYGNLPRPGKRQGTFIVQAYRAGYIQCSCRDCFEGPIIGVPGDLCDGCSEAGCEVGDHECSNPLAYGGEGEG